MEPRLRTTAGDIDEDLGDGALRHALGGVDGKPDGALRLVHVDDGTRPDPARQLMSDTQDPQPVACLRLQRSGAWRGTASAMRQLILVEPISSAAMMPPLGAFAPRVPDLPCNCTTVIDATPQTPALQRLAAFGFAALSVLRGDFGDRHRHLARKPQIHRPDPLRQQLLRPVETRRGVAKATVQSRSGSSTVTPLSR